MRVQAIELTEFGEATPDSHQLLRGATLVRPLHRVQEALVPLLQIDELRSGLRIRAGDMTGAATFHARANNGAERVVIRTIVRPRNPHLSFGDVLGMLAVVELGQWFSGVVPIEAGDDHVDALCRAMVQEARRLIRRGLARSYVWTDGDLRAPRGRIDAKKMAVGIVKGQDRLRCRYALHTVDNPHNEFVAAGLKVAHRFAGNPALRRATTRILNAGIQSPPGNVPQRPTFYGGQYAEYRTPHDIAALLLDGLGVGADRALHAALVPFVVETNLLFQRFVTLAIRTTLGRRFEVRSESLRVFERSTTDRERAVIPDIVVRDRNTNRIVLVVDAKYETAFPTLGAGDYYQAYVYGDVLGRLNEPRPLPVVLASPFAETKAVDCQRVAARIDGRAHRPVTWLVGIDMADVLRSMAGRRPTPNLNLLNALTLVGMPAA